MPKFETHPVFGYRKKACATCGGPACSASKRLECAACYRKAIRAKANPANTVKPCADCGKRCYSKYSRCKDCRTKFVASQYPSCANCSAKMTKKITSDTPICSKCRMANLRWHPNHNPAIPQEDRDNPVSNRLMQEGYLEWRVAVLAANRSTCSSCLSKQSRAKKLDCHHIMNYRDYPRLRVDTENGAPLCKTCHKAFHATFGIRGNNRDQFNLYMAVNSVDGVAVATW